MLELLFFWTGLILPTTAAAEATKGFALLLRFAVERAYKPRLLDTSG